MCSPYLSPCRPPTEKIYVHSLPLPILLFKELILTYQGFGFNRSIFIGGTGIQRITHITVFM